MKKILLILLAVIFITSMLFMGIGCKKEAAPAEEAVAEEEEVAEEAVQKATLLVWVQGAMFEEFMLQAIKEFMAKNPNITVTEETKDVDPYYSLLNTAIQAGSSPDIFWTHGTKTSVLPNLVAQGVVMDLTDKIDVSKYDKEAPFATSVIRVDDRIYLTPQLAIDTRVVFYNKTIFDQNGLSVPKTYDDFVAICDKLLTKGIIPMSLGASSSWDILFQFEPMLVALAPDWVDDAVEGKAKVNDPRVVNVMNEMLSWAKKGYFGKDYAAVDMTGQILAFTLEKVAMTVAGTWEIKRIHDNNPDLDVGAFKIPSKDGKQPEVVTPNSGYSVYAKTKYPDAAVEFIKFLNSVEGQQIYITETGCVPAIAELKGVSPLVQEASKADSFYESFYNILKWWQKPDTSPQKIWDEDSPKLFTGGITVQSFLDTLDSMQDYTQTPKK